MGKLTNLVLAVGTALVINEMIEKDEQGKRTLNPEKATAKARELGVEAREMLEKAADRIKEKAEERKAEPQPEAWSFTDAHRCKACGNALVEGAPFCANCGQAVPKEEKQPCPACKAEAAKGSKFCPYCGAAHLAADAAE